MSSGWLPGCLVAMVYVFGAATDEVRAADVVMQTTTQHRLQHRAAGLELILDEVERAQRGERYYRRPVPQGAIDALSRRLSRSTGRHWTREATTATVDYVHAHARESRRSDPHVLRAKLVGSLSRYSAAFHGLVAEIPEARAREMLLTRDIRSQHFDLTQDRPRPRSLQVKVFADHNAAVRGLRSDLRGVHPRARYGVMPSASIAVLKEQGVLRQAGKIWGDPSFAPSSGTRMTVLPMRSFPSVEESRRYTELGRRHLAFALADPNRLRTTGTGRPAAPLLRYTARALRGVIAAPLIAGIDAADAALGGYRYFSGQIGGMALLKRVAPSASAWSATAAGAGAGSIIPGVGTLAGATVGAIVGIPLSLVATRSLNHGDVRRRRDAPLLARLEALRKEYKVVGN